MKKSILSKKVADEVDKVGSADILVGIPSFNNEETIGYVTETVQLGLVKYFPTFKAIIVHSDCGSTDQTRRIIQKETGNLKNIYSILIHHEVHPFSRAIHVPPTEILSVFRETPGKGNAFRRIFEIGKLLGVKVCVTVDADLRSITPEWIQLLGGPILYQGYDYVVPLYFRHKYDATITNTIIYPLVRALYGKIIRQPIGGEFGFSKSLLSSYLQRNVWDTDIAFYGIDIWMTTVALAENFKLAQAFLGTKIHNPRETPSSLVPMFKQVISTLFALMEDYERTWKKIEKAEKIKTFGHLHTVIPEEVRLDLPAMGRKFREGLSLYDQFYKKILEEKNYKKIKTLPKIKKEVFISPSFWAQIIYDYASFYHHLRQAKDYANLNLLIESLIPLYFGYVASFVFRTSQDNNDQAEEKIEELCLEFEKQKPYLVKRWRRKGG